MAVSLQNVSKIYGGRIVAVANLNLEIGEGEFFTLLGPSGCGKTTTLRMIAGLEAVTTGTIAIRGRDVTTLPARRRDVAMVFQSYALYPHMTVQENITLNLQVKKVPRAEIEARLRQVATTLGIANVLDRKPGQLSGGQRQRVALARAIIRRPNVFLLDEPLSNLDLKLREQTRTELKRLHEELRITTVYVTHDQSEALVLSDRIGIMNAGKLLQVGSPQEVYERPADVFVARFIGSPSINLLQARLRGEADGLYLEVAVGADGTSAQLRHRLSGPAQRTLAERRNDATLTLGIRPEDLVLHRAEAPGLLPARVDFVEPMGSVNYVILRVPGGEHIIQERDHLVAAVAAHDELPRGTRVWLGARGGRLSQFDATSGRAIAVA